RAVLASTVMVGVLAAWFAVFVSAQQASTLRPPTFELDPKWPAVPNNWVFGEVSSIAVDSRDHIWVCTRPRSIPAEKRANAAPPVLEFDTAGKLLSSWGGDGAGFDWAAGEDGTSVRVPGVRWVRGQ